MKYFFLGFMVFLYHTPLFLSIVFFDSFLISFELHQDITGNTGYMGTFLFFRRHAGLIVLPFCLCFPLRRRAV